MTGGHEGGRGGEAAPPPTRWGVVAVTLAVGVVIAMQVGKVAPALPQLRAELGLGLVAAGWVVSVFSATAALLGIASGGVVEGLGRRRTLMGGLACLAAGALLGAFAGDGGALLASRFLEGLGFVVATVAAPSLIVAASHPRHHNLVLGLWGAYMPTGMAIVTAASPFLLAPVGWRAMWQANAVLVVLVLVLVLLVTRGFAPSARRGVSLKAMAADVRLGMSRPGPWLLGACFASYTLQWISLMAWLPTYLIEEQGRSLTQSVSLTALAIAINAPGNLTAAWLLHRGAQRWLLIAGASAAMACLAVGALWPGAPDPARYAMCLAFSYIGGMLPAAVLAGAPVHAPRPALIGIANGAIVQGANLGSLMGPPALAALVAVTGGWHGSSWGLGAMGLAGVALAFTLRAVERRSSR